MPEITEQMIDAIREYMGCEKHPIYPTGEDYVDGFLDLNFLFEVAEKVGIERVAVYLDKEGHKLYYSEVYPEMLGACYTANGNTPAEALFLALYQPVSEALKEMK